MKVTFFSLLAKFMPEQVKAYTRQSKEDSQSMLSLKPAEAPIASNCGQIGCVSKNTPDYTNQPRKLRAVLSFIITKLQELFKRLSVFIPIKQQPEKAIVVNEKVASEYIVDGDFDTFINNSLNQLTAKLALSNNIDDIATAFKQIDQLLGKTDFVIAVMISVIHEKKLWKRFGYPSMSRFLDDLPGVCKVSRQVFNNAAQAGQVIRHFSSPLFRYSKSELYSSLSPAIFYNNYSKIRFLYRIFFVWKIPLEDEVLVNFRDMTYRDFELFMKVYEVQKKVEIVRASYREGLIGNGNPFKAKDPKPILPEALIRKYKLTEEEVLEIIDARLHRLMEPKAPKLKKDKAPNLKKAEIPKLIGQDMAIYQEIRLGHTIGYVFSNNPVYVDSVSRYLHNASKRKEKELNKRYHEASEIVNESEPNISYANRDWADLYPDCLSHSFHDLEGLISRDLSPNAIKNVFYEKFKTKTELTLVQAHLLWRIKNERELEKSLSQYMTNHVIDSQWDSVKGFFIKVLDVEESRYKWLVRISLGMEQLRFFKNLSVRFTSEGFLEKLSYLPTALKNHGFNYILIAHALNTLSTKRFREYACNKYDNLSSEPITMNDYLKAKPFIDKLHSYRFEGKTITIIGLNSENELRWLDQINQANKPGYEPQRRYFPGIVWDSNSQDEYTIETNSGSGGVNEYECKQEEQEDDVTKDDLERNISDNSQTPVA